MNGINGKNDKDDLAGELNQVRADIAAGRAQLEAMPEGAEREALAMRVGELEDLLSTAEVLAAAEGQGGADTPGEPDKAQGGAIPAQKRLLGRWGSGR